MLFNSYGFIFIFLPATFFIYFLLNKYRLVRLSPGWLGLCSLIFYSWWDIRNLPIILLSIIINFTIGARLNKGGRKVILVTGLAFNLALLFYYKYFNFFIDNINHALSAHINIAGIILPLGISFFTFTQIAYLVDAYRGKAKEYNLTNYVLFVTFFPHLLAGPILHHKEMMPQFASLRNKVLNWENISHGLLLFSIGLFKKVVVADTFGRWADPGFTAQSLSMVQAWATAVSYTFQLYFDFSGYTDMALGIALFFNIRLPQKFQFSLQGRLHH